MEVQVPHATVPIQHGTINQIYTSSNRQILFKAKLSLFECRFRFCIKIYILLTVHWCRSFHSMIKEVKALVEFVPKIGRKISPIPKHTLVYRTIACLRQQRTIKTMQTISPRTFFHFTSVHLLGIFKPFKKHASTKFSKPYFVIEK